MKFNLFPEQRHRYSFSHPHFSQAINGWQEKSPLLVSTWGPSHLLGKGRGNGPTPVVVGHMGVMGGTVSTWAELGAQHSLIVSRHKMK